MDLSRMQFSASGTYPSIGKLAPNPRYAQVMLDNYGGVISEMSAVSLYMNNSIVQDLPKPDISHIFMKIAEVEMHHLNIFGTLACHLGQKPILRSFKGNRYVNWCACFNQYPNEFMALMKNALNSELTVINKYEKQLRIIQDPLIQQCLTKIIADEEVHVKIFTDIIKSYQT